VFEALGIHNVLHMYHIIIYGVSSSTIFSTPFHKLRDFRKAILNTLNNYCLKYFSLYEELSEICSKMYIGSHVKGPLILFDFNET